MKPKTKIEVRLEPTLKSHVVEFYKTQPVTFSEDIREYLVKKTKYKKKN